MKQIVAKITKYFSTIAVLIALPAHRALAIPSFPCPPGLNCGQVTNVNGFILMVIGWLLGITFGIAVLFLIIGGFWYITSAGNEETAEKGRKTVVNAIIGLVLIILSYVIINVVVGTVGGVPGAQ